MKKVLNWLDLGVPLKWRVVCFAEVLVVAVLFVLPFVA